MSIPALSAARSLCEISDWSVSNLRLQKILYIAHTFYLGTYKEPLIDELFEAWMYGPVVPVVYHRAKVFGNGPVRNVFHWVEDVQPDTKEYLMLKQAYEVTRGFSGSRLISITHWDKGAWHKCYKTGEFGIPIQNDLINDEFHERTRKDT